MTQASLPAWCRVCCEPVDPAKVTWKYGSVPHCPSCGAALVGKG